MEACERWTLNDATDKPIRAWDSRRFIRRTAYDELRRPAGLFVTESGVERLAELTVYGEGLGDADNHRTRVHQLFDGAGVVTSEIYDFKGNLLRRKRELLPDYKQAVNWLQNLATNDGAFTSDMSFDALNRPVTMTTPDNSVYQPTFNEANLLDRLEVSLRDAATATPFVTNVSYNAKGQRELIAYGNGAQTAYEYDPLTFRLTKLATTRPANPGGVASQLFNSMALLQDLRYAYDPAGNITRIEDAALKTVFHNGEQVEPVCGYTYDAIYRLVEARGREHIGQTAFDFAPPNGNRRDFPFFGSHANPNDPQAMRNYTESYEYDEVGNFKFLRHNFNGGGWNRAYNYDEASLLEPDKASNRLTRATAGGFTETYAYTDAQGADVHGCMTAINAPTPLQRYQLGNHLLSAGLELDADGALISYEEYHPYGATSFQAGRSATELSLKRYRYTGKERDEETGFTYHGARYYAPWLGRWTSCDPIGIDDGVNIYAYVANRPIDHLDADGRANTPIHEYMTRLVAMQYVDSDTASKIGKATNVPDTEKYYSSVDNSLGGDPNKVNRDVHVLWSGTREEKVKDTIARYSTRDVDHTKDKIRDAGIYLLHPLQDASYHGTSFGRGMGHALSPESDLAVGEKTFEEFYQVVADTEKGLELMQKKGVIKTTEKPAISRLSKDEWMGIYKDLKSIESSYDFSFGALDLLGIGGALAGPLAGLVGGIIGGIIGAIGGFLAGLLTGENVFKEMASGAESVFIFGQTIFGVGIGAVAGLGAPPLKDALRNTVADKESAYMNKKISEIDSDKDRK